MSSTHHSGRVATELGYAATKWGLNGWSEALRQELQPDVRVIVVEPGAVATELLDHITRVSLNEILVRPTAQA